MSDTDQRLKSKRTIKYFKFHGAWLSYIEHTIRSRPHKEELKAQLYIDPDDLLYAFEWIDTPEKENYWNTLYVGLGEYECTYNLERLPELRRVSK